MYKRQGGAGMLILASLGRRASSLICVTPVQEPVEYYYRASSMLRFEHVLFVAPTPEPIPVSYTHLDVYKRQGAGCLSGTANAFRRAHAL